MTNLNTAVRLWVRPGGPLVIVVWGGVLSFLPLPLFLFLFLLPFRRPPPPVVPPPPVPPPSSFGVGAVVVANASSDVPDASVWVAPMLIPPAIGEA